jgi:glycosyltransferase involved in cell wall biosynthesis
LNNSIGVVLLTLNAEKQLNKSLPPVINSPLNPKVLVIDSSSTDKTVEIAKGYGAEVVIISKEEFNHGATREKGRKLLKTDIVIFQTQDVYPLDESVVEKLIVPIKEGKAEISYGRQIPHDNAQLFESFPREFNYPSESNVRSIKNLQKYGFYTFFNSHSWAAYLNSALDKSGGIKPALTNEDYITTAKMLKDGFRIAYVAESIVKHSHKYNLIDQFKRYFDTGYIRAENKWLTEIAGQAEKLGGKFVKELLKKTIKEKPLMIPYVFLSSFVKWSGFRTGYLGLKLPRGLKKKLSEQNYYWDSVYYKIDQ